jgi:hypothetical protein
MPSQKKKFSHHFYIVLKKNVLERGAINIVPGGEKSLNTALIIFHSFLLLLF